VYGARSCARPRTPAQEVCFTQRPQRDGEARRGLVLNLIQDRLGCAGESGEGASVAYGAVSGAFVGAVMLPSKERGNSEGPNGPSLTLPH
jgi:hypothetical protein